MTQLRFFKISLVLVLGLSACSRSVPGESQPPGTHPLLPAAPKLTLVRTIAMREPFRAAFLPGSNEMIIGAQHPARWNCATGKHLQSFALPSLTDVELLDVHVSSRANLIMGMCIDTPADKSKESSVIALWDLKSARLMRVQRAQSSEGYFAAVALSPDGKTVATAQSRIRLWDAHSGKLAHMLRPGHFSELYFSPEGGRLLAASATDAILFDLKTKAEVRLPDAGAWDAMVFSPDGGTIAALDRSVDSAGAIRWFDARTGNLIRRVRLRWSFPLTADASALCYSRDGQTLIIAGGHRGYEEEGQSKTVPEQGEVLFYGAKDGRFRARHVIDSFGEVLRIALSPDGKTLATLQPGEVMDGAVRLWKLE